MARLTLSVCAVVSALGLGEFAGAASLTPISRPDVTSVRGRDISGDGSTVVGVYTTASQVGAYRWTAADGFVSIGTGSSTVTAWGVNADGSVIVGDSLPNMFDVFRWTSASGPVAIGNLGGVGSLARQVNAGGNVVVGRSGGQAFRWTQATGMVGIGSLPGGSGGDAFDVSDDGSVIVGRSGGPSGQEAFRWTQATGVVGLGDLPDGAFNSEALGISGDGAVIVGAANSADGRVAFRHTVAGGMVNIGDLPGGTVSAEANAVSDDGLTLTGRGTTADGSEAFVWTQAGGMQRLWEVLLAAGVDPAADGWSNLSVGNGISATGTHIAGQGLRNGNMEAFLAVIPEPASVTLLAPAMLALARRRR